MDFSTLLGTTPILLTIIVVQFVKHKDQKSKMKRGYYLISIGFGFVFGVLYSSLFTTIAIQNASLDFVQLFRDGLQNAMWSVFIIGFKKPLGLVLPGDSTHIRKRGS